MKNIFSFLFPRQRDEELEQLLALSGKIPCEFVNKFTITKIKGGYRINYYDMSYDGDVQLVRVVSSTFLSDHNAESLRDLLVKFVKE